MIYLAAADRLAQQLAALTSGPVPVDYADQLAAAARDQYDALGLTAGLLGWRHDFTGDPWAIAVAILQVAQCRPCFHLRKPYQPRPAFAMPALGVVLCADCGANRDRADDAVLELDDTCDVCGVHCGAGQLWSVTVGCGPVAVVMFTCDEHHDRLLPTPRRRPLWRNAHPR